MSGKPDKHEAMLRCFDTIERTEAPFLHYPYIPLGRVTYCFGNPGDGKTTYMLAIAALLTTGQAMPLSDHAPFVGNVIFQSAEDNAGDTLKPRLMAAGADCSKVFMTENPNVDIAANCQTLDNAARQSDARLLVLDPVQAFLGKDGDMTRASVMRGLMNNLAKIAADNNCAVVTIGHMTKASGAKSLYCGLGSIDITASARSVLMISRSEADPDVRVVQHIKSSLAPEGSPIGFSIGDNSSVEFFEYAGSIADSAVYADNKREMAKETLLRLLSGEPKLCNDILEACLDMDISERTLKRAKQELGVHSVWTPDGWLWKLHGNQAKSQ